MTILVANDDGVRFLHRRRLHLRVHFVVVHMLPVCAAVSVGTNAKRTCLRGSDVRRPMFTRVQHSLPVSTGLHPLSAGILAVVLRDLDRDSRCIRAVQRSATNS